MIKEQKKLGNKRRNIPLYLQAPIKEILHYINLVKVISLSLKIEYYPQSKNQLLEFDLPIWRFFW